MKETWKIEIKKFPTLIQSQKSGREFSEMVAAQKK
jgi:tartrate dehydratase beta subunit/fumarate hydratase class I family protein